MNRISILGCGWLGFPLAISLIENGYAVKGSTTSESKLQLLQSAGIKPSLISLESEKTNGDITEFLSETETLIIDIPPKVKAGKPNEFIEKIKTLIPFIEKAAVHNVLFISSTSVYADDDSLVSEETIAKPDTESGKQLLAAEQLLQNNPNFKTTILRFAGLIGEDRHPIHSLSGKENIKNPLAPINLIHQADCINIIKRIIEMREWSNIFNAAAPYHPSREAYYTQKAIQLNLPLPKFNHDLPSVGKTINSEKLQKPLDYQFTEIHL